MSNYLITSPIGGFGNHLRWLLLLDNQFDLSTMLSSYKQELVDNYFDVSGSDWPTFDGLSDKNFPQDLDKFFDLADLLEIQQIRNCNNKLEFILNYVYPNTRTWHNWLQYEWNYRTYLDQFIKFSHRSESISQDYKSIAMTVNPELALRCYRKFNSNLNNSSATNFLRGTARENSLTKTVSADHPTNVLLLDSELLYNSVLDKDLYSQIVNWFGLENNYSTAQQIHKKWFDLHQKAERELLNDLSRIYDATKI